MRCPRASDRDAPSSRGSTGPRERVGDHGPDVSALPSLDRRGTAPRHAPLLHLADQGDRRERRSAVERDRPGLWPMSSGRRTVWIPKTGYKLSGHWQGHHDREGSHCPGVPSSPLRPRSLPRLPAGQATAQELTSEQSDPRGCVTTERTGQGVVTRALTAPHLSRDRRPPRRGRRLGPGGRRRGHRSRARRLRLSRRQRGRPGLRRGGPAAGRPRVPPLGRRPDGGPRHRPGAHRHRRRCRRGRAWSTSTRPTRAPSAASTRLGLDLTEHAGTDERGAYTQRRARRPGRGGRAPRRRPGLRDRRPRPGRAVGRAARGRPRVRADRRHHRHPERAHHLPAPVRLRGRAQGPRRAEPRPGHPDHAAERDLRGQDGPGHRDHDQPRQQGRRQAGLPADGRAPRARVALGRARDGVGLRADRGLPGQRRAPEAPGREHPHDRDPDRQPRRLQHLARGRARRWATAAATPRTTRSVAAVAAPNEYRRKNCRLLDDSPAGNCAQPAVGLAVAGRRPEPQLRRLLGRPRRGDDADRRGLPRPRPVLRARDPEHPLPRLEPPGGHPDHQPHLLQPGPAPARRRGPGRPGGRAALQGVRRRDGGRERIPEPEGLPALRHDRHDRGLVVLHDRRPRLHLRDRVRARGPGRRPNENCIGNFHPPFAETVAEYDGTGAGRDRGRRGAATARPTRSPRRARPTRRGTR